MEILTSKRPQGYVVKLRGELDAQTATDLEKVLNEVIKLRPREVQVDCRELRYISSRGLGVFVALFQEIQEKNIHFCLFNMSPSVKNVFRVLGLNQILSIDPEKSSLAEPQA